MNHKIESGGDFEIGSFRVPGRKLHDALQLISDDELTIETTDASAIIRFGKSSKLTLPLISEPMPSVPEAEWSKPVLIEDLQGKLRTLLPFCSKAIHRPELQSIHFGKEVMEVADGRRIGWIDLKGMKLDSVVPTELCQLVAKTEGTVTTRFSPNMAEFSGEGWTITGKLIEAKYADIRSLRKQVTVFTVKSSARELIEASSQAAFELSTNQDSIKVRTAPDQLIFTDGKHELPCDAEVSEGHHNFALSASALESALVAVTPEGRDEVELSFSDAFSFSVEHAGVQVVCMLTRLD
jgi:DNA polymerase III sliding clamp (beta) subunit (PCNA family)